MTLKSRRSELTETARRDLRALAEYVRQFDEGAAERLIADLVRELHHIARIGVTGSTRPFLPDGVRAFPYRNWCFYFTVDDEKLSVVRVLRGAQDSESSVFLADDETH